MTLSDEQKAHLATWVSEGLSLSDIQKRIEKDWNTSMTYMDVRFLVDDLDLTLKDKEQPKKADPEADKEQNAAPEMPGAVSVDVDAVKRPGCLASGNVVFSDGISCSWQVDQMGRLGLIPSQEGYQPSQEDLQEFQMQLQGKLQGV